MGNKVKLVGEGDTGNQGVQSLYVFYCPGCKFDHGYHVPRWSWNGSLDAPTFQPSLRCIGAINGGDCHLTMTDGNIFYHGDSNHELKGQTIEMKDYEE